VPTPDRQVDGEEDAGYGAADEGVTNDTFPVAQVERPEHEGIENPDKNPDQATDPSSGEGGPNAEAG
jgi:hypothetical protein